MPANANLTGVGLEQLQVKAKLVLQAGFNLQRNKVGEGALGIELSGTNPLGTGDLTAVIILK